MRPVSFHASREVRDLVRQIVARAQALFLTLGERAPDGVAMEMDLLAVHNNVVSLDLPALLAAPDVDFAHDIGGIGRHLNRRTVELDGCFCPRFVRREGVAV